MTPPGLVAPVMPTPHAPGVAEMAALIRRKRSRRELLELDAPDLVALAASGVDDETRMLAQVLATMSPGQRTLLRFKTR